MKKVLKVIGKVLLVLLVIILVFLLGVFVFNKIMLSKEKVLLENQQIGQLVEVDGHNMSIYVSGEGEHTLVFMAGSGASTPIISYKTFAERFDGDYRIVIIEKFGYGFSDGFDGPRDVETRVRQNREVLEAAGITGPYILCPHSYSGLEAVYWAQNYPDEIEAIIGLDMAVPRSYDIYDEEIIKTVNSSDALKRTLRNMGITRLLVGGTLSEDFTEEEKQIVTAIACSTYGNTTASNEANYIISDLEIIDSKTVPDVPTLLIISDGTIADGWIDFEMDYAFSLSEVTTVKLDCGHSVYKYEPERCEEEMREFIASLDSER
ncbi:MAG: alpha/beta hydrolase [Lachnospiraceae bacterium]|nr:alpha/beta hydrolase [Lachnospiraceae bacterium]